MNQFKRRRPKTVIKSERGFTLIGVMVAGAIGSIVVLTMATSISAMYSAQSSVLSSGEAQLLVDQIRMSVGRERTCGMSLNGFDYDPGAAVSVSGFPITIDGTAGTLTAGAPAPGTSGLLVRDISLVPNSTVPPVITKIITSPPMVSPVVMVPARRHTASLRITLEKTNQSAQGRFIPPTFIPIQIMTALGAGATPILGCNSAPTDAAVCAELSNFVWDVFTNKCLPANQCLSGGSFSDAPIGDGGFVNPLTGGMSCPGGYEKRRSGSVAKASQTGKKQVTNVYYATYECSRCFTANGDVTANGSLGNGSVPIIDETLGISDSEYDTAEGNFTSQGSQINTVSTQLANAAALRQAQLNQIETQQNTITNQQSTISSRSGQISTLQQQVSDLQAELATYR